MAERLFKEDWEVAGQKKTPKGESKKSLLGGYIIVI